MSKRLADLDIKYAALLIVEPDGTCWLVKPGYEPVAVRIEKVTP